MSSALPATTYNSNTKYYVFDNTVSNYVYAGAVTKEEFDQTISNDISNKYFVITFVKNDYDSSKAYYTYDYTNGYYVLVSDLKSIGYDLLNNSNYLFVITTLDSENDDNYYANTHYDKYVKATAYDKDLDYYVFINQDY